MKNLLAVSNDIPSEVFDFIEKSTSFEVNRQNRPDNVEEFEELPMEGPYSGNEAASVLGYDIDDTRYDSLTSFMKYGLEVSVRVYPNGDTYIYEINGEELQNPVQVR